MAEQERIEKFKNKFASEIGGLTLADLVEISE